jgi:Xaa-Pro aminopeptidase
MAGGISGTLTRRLARPHPTPPLAPPMDYPDRRRRLLKLLKSESLPALLVTSETNVSYLTGFTGDSTYLYLTPTDALLISDSRYEEQLGDECPDLKVEIRSTATKMHEAVGRVLKQAKAVKVGLEGSSVTWEFVRTLQEKSEQVEFVPTSGLVESLREIKDKQEVEAIRRAIECAQKAFAVLRASLRPDLTEKQVADDLEYRIRTFGGTAGAFPSIIGVGARAALPHGRPGEKRIEESEFVLVDWGARVGGYVSDLTRVLVTGKISPKLERLYRVVLTAQLAAIDAIRPGAVMKEVDAVARSIITRAGFGKQFGHSLGHGIGRDVHESPRLAVDWDRPLQAGMVVTVEPGIYLPGWGGIRIEDDVLVTREGHEVLSSVPKELADSIVN